MKINVGHMLRMAGKQAGSSFRHSLPELADNLRELRDRTREGDMKALDEFFAVYVFGDDVCAKEKISQQQPSAAGV